MQFKDEIPFPTATSQRRGRTAMDGLLDALQPCSPSLPSSTSFRGRLDGRARRPVEGDCAVRSLEKRGRLCRASSSWLLGLALANGVLLVLIILLIVASVWYCRMDERREAALLASEGRQEESSKGTSKSGSCHQTLVSKSSTKTCSFTVEGPRLMKPTTAGFSSL